MAVNLNGIDLGGSTAAGSARKASSSHGNTAGSPDAANPPQGEVSITSTASLLAQLQRSLSGKPAIDQARVDAISKALADGKYTVNPDKIARGLSQAERTLGSLPLPEI